MFVEWTMSELCVVCDRQVTARQHAISCDDCERWQHRLCDTGMCTLNVLTDHIFANYINKPLHKKMIIMPILINAIFQTPTTSRSFILKCADLYHV